MKLYIDCKNPQAKQLYYVENDSEPPKPISENIYCEFIQSLYLIDSRFAIENINMIDAFCDNNFYEITDCHIPLYIDKDIFAYRCIDDTIKIVTSETQYTLIMQHRVTKFMRSSIVFMLNVNNDLFSFNGKFIDMLFSNVTSVFVLLNYCYIVQNGKLLKYDITKKEIYEYKSDQKMKYITSNGITTCALFSDADCAKVSIFNNENPQQLSVLSDVNIENIVSIEPLKFTSELKNKNYYILTSSNEDPTNSKRMQLFNEKSVICDCLYTNIYNCDKYLLLLDGSNSYYYDINDLDD